MKKLLLTLASVCIFLALSPTFAAFAVEGDTAPSNVTITVVMPEKTDSSEQIVDSRYGSAPVFLNVYPIDITENRDNGERQIIKTYELNANERPSDIPRDSFERSGWKFVLTDILRKETANAEIKEHKEIVTLNTDTKDMEKILALLDTTLDFKTEDDFGGLLTLDVASIKVETAGTKTSSYEMKVTREYPHLSTNDTSLVPKTTDEKGKTYNLTGINWKTETVENIDYSNAPTSYTAIATYTATGTTTKVTGYTTTAEYNGTLAKMSQGKTIYTTYFEGEEIRTPLEMTELPTDEHSPATTEEVTETPISEPSETAVADPTDVESEPTNNSNTALYAIIALLALMLGGATYLLKRKGKFQNEKIGNTTSVADYDSDTGTPGVSD
jgi:hypothetical protein